MKRQFAIWGICLGSMLLSGCLPEKKVSIYPVDQETDVPVETMINIYVDTSTQATPKNVTDDHFALSTCKEQETTDESKSDENKESTNNKESSTPTQVIHERVPVSINVVPTQDLQAMEDETENAIPKRGLMITLTPLGAKDQDTPLLPNTTYCIQTKPFKTDDGETVPAQQSQFTTEAVPGMLYANEAYPNAPQTEIALQNDFIVMQFDDPINPKDLHAHLKLCEKNDTAIQNTIKACEGFGQSMEFDLFVMEDLVRPEEDKFMYQNANVFLVRPHVDDQTTTAIRWVLDPTLGQASDPEDGLILRTLTIGTEKTGTTIREQIFPEDTTFPMVFAIHTNSKMGAQK